MADKTTKIKMMQFRQGWFYGDALHEGETYELPPETAKYLVELGAAQLVAKPRRRKKPTGED